MVGVESPQSSADPPAAGDKEKEKEEKPPFGNIWRILGYGSKLDLALMTVAALCAAGAGVTLPLMNIVFGNLVGNFNGYFIPGSGVTKEMFVDTVNQQVLYIVYLFIGKFILGYISMFSMRICGLRISARLRLGFLRALFKQPISTLDEITMGKPTTTITTHANTIQGGISDKLAQLVQSTSLLISAYAIAFRYSWSLTLVSTSSLVFMLIIYSSVIPIYLKLQKRMENADEKAAAIATEAFGSIRTIVACGAEGRLAERYASWVAESRKRGLRIAPLLGVHLFPSGFAVYSNLALTFWFGIRQFSKGNLSNAGPVVTVIFSVMIVVQAISGIVSPLMSISKAITASTNFFDIIDSPPLRLTGLKEPEVSAREDIIFSDVNFSYPKRPGVKILDNLSLRFPAGRVTALVGPSGCGKSTIVSLLLRWYQITSQIESGSDTLSESGSEGSREGKKGETDTSTKAEPNSGVISIGSHNVDDLDIKWWRSQIGLVAQEPFSFNASIYTNVSYGLVGSKWEAEPEEKKRQLVKDACKEAFAEEFIDRLPDGYDTMVGENGLKLSGGQRQRLAIARSIVSRPSILILDEATSSIDVRGERIVQEALDRVSQGRTTITIAHRLSTIKKADKIIVLREGGVVEEGTHTELLQKGGLYSSLVENQQLEMGDEEEIDTAAEESADRTPLALSKTRSRTGTSEAQDGAVSAGEAQDKPQSLINSLGLFLWEQRKLWPLYTGVLLGAAGCGAGFSIQAYLFARLIETFQFTGSELLSRGDFWALMFFILALVCGICYFVLGWSAHSVAMNISNTYRSEYFESIVHKPIEFYDREENSTGSLTARLSSDPTQIQELLGVTMALPLVSVYNVLGCIAISFSFGWKLTLVAAFSAFPLIIGAMFVRVRYEVKFDKMNAAVFAESSQFASEAIGAIRTVTSLTLEDTITEDRYSTLLQSHVKAAFRKGTYASLVLALSDSLELPCMALCLWYGGQLLSTYEYNVVQFFTIFMALIMGGQAAGQFGSVTPNIAQATESSNRILATRVSDKRTNQGSGTLDDSRGGAKIEFKSVHFTYPTRNVTVFKNLSFTIQKGQFAALVGPSGCGKTSVVSLLERFYDYQHGSILIDGIELRSFDIEKYRSVLALVSQEPTLYQGSIRDNILLGVDPTSVTDDDVIQVSRDAEIHDFIVSLPDGYNTDVGQRGLTLSGGQKQRICIARALIRQPTILMLDEATSSLDSESEKLVQRAFERTAKGKTVVVVAHRLATIQNADIIFVFGEGGIMEVGTHQSLLRQRGAYFQMCESQALDR